MWSYHYLHILHHFVSNFHGTDLPLDVLQLYKNVSNRQECEGLQGDLGVPLGGGGLKIPADVTQASSNRAADSVGGVGLVTRERTKETLTSGSVTIRYGGTTKEDCTKSMPGTVLCDFYLVPQSSRCHPQAPRGAGARTSRAQVLWAVRCGE